MDFAPSQREPRRRSDRGGGPPGDRARSTASSTVASTQTSVSDLEVISACLALAQVLDQPGFGEGGIACFVDKRRGRAKRGQRRHQLQQLEIEAFAGMVICPCMSDCLVG
jgi:hypothetical protein